MRDLVDRQAAINEVSRFIGYIDEDMIERIQIGLKRLPTAQTNLQQTCNQIATDCIDRQEAIDAIREHKRNVLGEREWDEGIAFGYAAAHEHICDIIKALSTIDAVPVVRCKNCIHFDSEDDCDCPMDVRYSDFFCKMGERRSDEQT